MERIRREVGDKTVLVDDVNLRRRLRQLRRSNGGDIGVFFLDDNIAQESWADPETGFSIKEGEGFAELHLLTDAFIVRQELLDSLVGISYYLKDREDIKYVMATTYRRMAQMFGHFGFTLSNNPHPADERFIRQEYHWTGRGQAGKPIEDVWLIFQERERFLEKYYSKNTD